MKEWTEQQRKAISARNCNLLVSAGAGSGKTAVMLERICSLLREGADIRKMTMCTFTKTAAADMRRKLSETLADCVEKTGDAWLEKQLARLPAAEISTLHSWCAHIIKKWFFYSDLEPEFTVAEEAEEAALKSEAAEEVLEEEKERGDEAFAGLYAAFLSNRSHRRLKEAMLAVYDYSRAQPNPDEWLLRSASRKDSEYREILFSAIKRDAEKLVSDAEKLLADLAAAKFNKDYEALAVLKECMESEVACTLTTPQLRNKPELEELHARFKELKAQYAELCRRREKIESMPSHETSLPYCRALAELAFKLGEKYAASKREKGKADYSDLEHQTLKILGGEHGERILSEYTHVFVDEYQDISPLQEEILKKFNCEMFFVGDVKQSIYGFRMCRPKFFIDKRERYRKGEGKTVELTANFRSGAQILNTVNGIFSAVMTDKFGGTDYACEKFTVGSQIDSLVKTVIIPPDEEKEEIAPEVYSVRNDIVERASKSLEAEADAVTDEILDMLDGGDGAEDGVDYGDIAVLVRSRGAFTDLLEKKLRAASVPVTAVASEQNAESFRSVSELMSFLRVLDNSHDDVNLAAVLLSQTFGKLSASELCDVRLKTEGELCNCLKSEVINELARPLSQKLAAFSKTISSLGKEAACATVAELAGKITAEFDCFNGALKAGGEREAAALDAFLEHLAASQENTLHGYLRFVRRTGEPKLKVRDGGRAVRIMTVHASKGLEFKCVILPQLHKRFNLRDVYASVICDEEEGVVLRSFDFTERAVKENPRFAVCAQKLRRTLAEEELRVLYVAMTRAKNKLVMFSQPPSLERAAEDTISYIDWLYPYVDKTLLQERKRESVSERATVCEPNEKLVAALKENFARVYRYSRGDLVKASVSGVVHANDEEAVPQLFSSDDRAAARGSACHKFMQWVNFNADGEWERLCKKFPEEAKLVERAQMEKAFEAVGKFIAGREFLREKQFVFAAPASLAGGSDSNKILVQGVIDLMVFNPDGSVTIVDYKTGAEANIANNAAYCRQLALYKSAVESVLGKRVNGAYLYAFSTGKFIKTE